MSSVITFNDATYRYIISADIMNPRNNDAIIFKGCAEGRLCLTTS